MARRKTVDASSNEEITAKQLDTVKVRYTGKGKYWNLELNLLCDPDNTESLTFEIDRDTFNNVLKPTEVFEIVV